MNYSFHGASHLECDLLFYEIVVVSNEVGETASKFYYSYSMHL